jgi:hypothetical protein
LRCGLVTDLTTALGQAGVSSYSPWCGVSTRVRAPLPAGAAIGGPDTPGHDGERGPGRDGEREPGHDGEREPGHDREREPGHDGEREWWRIAADGTFLLTADRPARGLATSGRACTGRGGRSFSFGIADSVSVLARTAARADAAATIIGNAVDLPGHPAIDRRPASDIDPASDLGDRLITFDVGSLTGDAIEAALDAGETMVDMLLRDGLIEGAVLALRGRLRVCHPSLALLESA